jgi:hypothetical protein
MRLALAGTGGSDGDAVVVVVVVVVVVSEEEEANRLRRCFLIVLLVLKVVVWWWWCREKALTRDERKKRAIWSVPRERMAQVSKEEEKQDVDTLFIPFLDWNNMHGQKKNTRKKAFSWSNEDDDDDDDV